MRTRTLLALSLLSVALASTAFAQPTAPAPQRGIYTLPPLAAPFISTSTIYREGGLSGLHYIGGNEFWYITDRGPNVDYGDNKVFATPEFQPRIYRIRAVNGTISILDSILLRSDAGGPASGLTNPAPYNTGEIAYDTLFNVLPSNEWGFDPEGIVQAPDGTFWFCEEYAPGIAQFGADGRIIRRIRPQPTPGGLPDILKKRNPNRGAEGICITPNGKIYTIVQSGMRNSYANTASANQTAGERTEMLRIVEFDPATNTSRMFPYLMDAGYPNGGTGIRKRDIKIGEMVALNNNELLLIEHAQRDGQNVKRVYKVGLTGATPITTEVFQTSPGTFKTLEELTRAEITTVAGLTPVTKTLVLNMLTPGTGNPVWPDSLDKPEGLAVLDPRTIIIGNDNDFGVASPSADGIITRTGRTTNLYVFRLAAPLDFQLGVKATVRANGAPIDSALGLFGTATSCAGEEAQTIPVTVSNPGTRPLVLRDSEIYRTDSTVGTGAPRYEMLRDANGELIPSPDYIITDGAASTPLNANAPVTFPVTIAPGESRTFNVNFIAFRPGRRYGRLILRTDATSFTGTDTNGVQTYGVVVADLYGHGTGAVLSDNPDGRPNRPLVFGRAPIGQAQTKWLRFVNTGACPLRIHREEFTIASGDIDEFAIATIPSRMEFDPGFLTVPPRSSDSILIRFTPRHIGARRATIYIRTNDSTVGVEKITERGTLILDLYGEGAFGLYAEDARIGDAAIGDTSTPAPTGIIRLRSAALNGVDIASINITGTDAADFTPANWPALPLTVAPASSLDLTLAFRPMTGTPGVRNALVEIVTATNDTIRATVWANAGTRSVAVNPSTVNFPALRVGRVARRTVTIMNMGTMPVMLGDAAMSGAVTDYSLGAFPRHTLAPGASEFLEITYSPTAPGATTATVTFPTNTGSPLTITLNGTGAVSRYTGDDDPDGALVGDGGCDTPNGGVEFGVAGIGSASTAWFLGAAPNPSNGSTVAVTLNATTAARATATLYNQNGVAVVSTEQELADAGRHTLHLNVTSLPAGLYHLRSTLGAASTTSTLIIAR